MELWTLGNCGELWKCEVAKYGGVKRSEEFETRISGSVVLKFLNDEIKKDLRS